MNERRPHHARRSERHLRAVQAVSRVGLALAGEAHRAHVICQGLSAIVEALEARAAILWLADEPAHLELAYSGLISTETANAITALPVPAGLAGADGQPQVAALGEVVPELALLLPVERLGSAMSVALVHEGTAQGTLLVLRPERRAFTAEDRYIGSLAAPLLAAALDRAHQATSQAELESAARHRLQEELNHRVRNNLAMLCALLEMEMLRAPQAERERLLVSLARIRTLSLVYNLLGHDQDGRVEVNALVRGVMDSVMVLCEQRSGEIPVTGTTVAYLSARRATYLGLALTELAVHMARPTPQCSAPQPPTVSVALTDGEVAVTMVDSNPGCSDRPFDTLSRDILVGLVQSSLGGQVDLPTGGACRAVIRCVLADRTT